MALSNQSSSSPFLGKMITTPHVRAELLGHEVGEKVQSRIRDTGVLIRTSGVAARIAKPLPKEESKA